jgi:aerobic carbon-monoxide dehydrogenase large subunit
MGLEATGHFASDYGHSAGAHLALVEIDRGTGATRIHALYAIDDAGTIVNPLLAEGQVLGGSAQGIGEALFEEATHDEYGQPRGVSFLEHPLVTAAEMPVVYASFQETPSPLNPLGIKGVGEGGACGAPCAVANAVADALAPLGAAPLDLPLTPEKVWRAIRAAGSHR